MIAGVLVLASTAAVAALRRAAHRAGLGDRVRAEAGDASRLAAVAPAGRLDVVVVNPPRKGLAPAVIEAIAAARPARVVYVSCGPQSLGRDLERLGAAGFAVTAIEPFDLMPGTAQVETVVRLEHR